MPVVLRGDDLTAEREFGYPEDEFVVKLTRGGDTLSLKQSLSHRAITDAELPVAIVPPHEKKKQQLHFLACTRGIYCIDHF